MILVVKFKFKINAIKDYFINCKDLVKLDFNHYIKFDSSFEQAFKQLKKIHVQIKMDSKFGEWEYFLPYFDFTEVIASTIKFVVKDYYLLVILLVALNI